MLNPDGRLWIDRLSGGLEDTGISRARSNFERVRNHQGVVRVGSAESMGEDLVQDVGFSEHDQILELMVQNRGRPAIGPQRRALPCPRRSRIPCDIE